VTTQTSNTGLTSAERTVVVSRLSVALREAGSGPPLLVIHRSTGPLWTPFYDRLARTFAVKAPDLPGFGRSQRPEWARSPRDEAILLHQLMAELDLDQIHVVGLGFGGWVAAEMATMNPRLMKSLVLVGAVGLKPRQGDIHDPLLKGFEDYVRLGFHDEARFEATFGHETAVEMLDLWDHSREMTARLNWKPWMFSWELPNLLPSVRTPTMAVWGRHDRVVPLDCGRQFAELLPDARLEIVEDAGHIVDLEKPDELAQLITDFCIRRS
jgi:pimeloyl-ACP methyl ester carboxylesterase